jgi:alpha-beta hydrolase superfamily lysophospholipase
MLRLDWQGNKSAPFRLNLRAIVVLIVMAGFSGSALAQSQTRSKHSERRTLPLTSFYETPDPLPPAPPGTLIRSERTYDYYLPQNITVFRILYHSRSANGRDVASSGVVLLPSRKPPDGAWPVIAWAHGLTGVARTCAPSLIQNLGQGSLLSMYVNLGYAVVTTDYAGLGTSFRNASVDAVFNAADVIYSVLAARAALPQLGSKWVAMGAFEGGRAALQVAEQESDLRDSNYLGSVSISGTADLRDTYQRVAKSSDKRSIVFLVHAVKTAFPQFRLDDVLTENGLALYRQIESSCNLPNTAGSDDILKPGWESNRFMQEFFARNKLGNKKAFAPLLVLSSDNDPAAPVSSTASVVDALCKSGDRVQFYRYSTPDPQALVGDSVRDHIQWIQGRFIGRPAPSNCTSAHP